MFRLDPENYFVFLKVNYVDNRIFGISNELNRCGLEMSTWANRLDGSWLTTNRAIRKPLGKRLLDLFEAGISTAATPPF